MDPKELNIGNHVKDRVGGIGVVHSVKPESVLVITEMEEILRENIHPVLLTLELVEQLGYKEDTLRRGKFKRIFIQDSVTLFMYETNQGDQLFSLYEIPSRNLATLLKNGSVNIQKIEHVHRLQNLHFELTNIKINLPL